MLTLFAPPGFFFALRFFLVPRTQPATERDDFASATSSRSTKLIHGGVRYLEKAVKQFDPGQLHLVFDALHERATFLKIAPHLTRKLPIMTPCYSWWEIPYYWAGMKMYDALSFTRRLGSSRYASAKESAIQFPVIRTDGLKGSIVYFDGQMDDSRMNVGLAMTAAANGASIANHVEVIDLLHETVEKVIQLPPLLPEPTTPAANDSDAPTKTGEAAAAASTEIVQAVPQPRFEKVLEERVCGARVRDQVTGEEWNIKAKSVVNATGAFVDALRDKDAHKPVAKMISPSAGTHIVLPDYYAPIEMGMIIPKTEDGRVVFLIPWQGKVVAGTTDEACEISTEPKPTEKEVDFILRAIAGYTSVAVRREDVMATWTGIRPLASDPHASNTENLLRDHIISVSNSGLLTISGGKWTTYRKMSSDVVDTLLRSHDYGKPLRDCNTENQLILGASGWNKGLFMHIIQNYYRVKHTTGQAHRAPMNSDIAQHLSSSYGVRAFLVAELATKGYGKRLAHGHPYIEAEVVHAVQNEYALTAVDVLARRLRLAFLDANGARQALPRTIAIMGELLNWDDAKKEAEHKAALRFLSFMNLEAPGKEAAAPAPKAISAPKAAPAPKAPSKATTDAPKEATPVPKEAAPAPKAPSKATTDAPKEAAPVSKEAAPVSKEAAPVPKAPSKATTDAPKEAAPVSKEAAPVSKEAAPAPKEAAPAPKAPSKATTDTPKEATPVPKEAAPAPKAPSKVTTDAPKETAPAPKAPSKATTDAPKETAPAPSKTTTDAPKETAPASKAPAKATADAPKAVITAPTVLTNPAVVVASAAVPTAIAPTPSVVEVVPARAAPVPTPETVKASPAPAESSSAQL